MIESILNNIKQTIKEVLSDMGVTEEVEILFEVPKEENFE